MTAANSPDNSDDALQQPLLSVQLRDNACVQRWTWAHTSGPWQQVRGTLAHGRAPAQVASGRSGRELKAVPLDQ